MNKIKLKNIVGEEWFHFLNDVLSPEVTFELDGVRKEYMQRKNIFPSSDKTWNIFKKCKLDNIKVIILLNDPIEYTKCDFILKMFNDSYPYHFNTKILDGDLNEWNRQGVLLLNTSLTVEVNKPNSHKHYWEKFTVKLIEKINKDLKNIVFVGSDKWLNKTTNKIIIEKSSVNNNILHTINDMLNKINKNKIDWNHE